MTELIDLITLLPDQAELLTADVADLEDAITAVIGGESTEKVTAGQDRYDTYPAVLVVAAGTGGQEAADFTRLLVRMYCKAFDSRGIGYELEELTYAADGRGIKRATFIFDQPGTYRLLKTQHGTQRLTRVSPFNAAGKKQTSFASVQVLPLLPEIDVQLNPEDLRWDTFHSSGPGGQSVNTTDSAVRLTHKPSGLTVSIQGRSQTQNKATALRVLASRLSDQAAESRADELQSARGDRQGSWGSTSRTFNLAGSSYVKDHRTGVTRHDPTRVLDGDMGELL